MEPDDNFSPPLDGLSRGNKLNQVLTAVSQADIVSESHYIREGQGGPVILGSIRLEDLIDIEDDQTALGFLRCNWWHMRFEPDWWEYWYYESGPEAEIGLVEDDESEEDRGQIEMSYICAWLQQANDVVDGLAYTRETTDDGWQYDEFDPPFESPRPLTRSILDTYLPNNIGDRYEDS